MTRDGLPANGPTNELRWAITECDRVAGHAGDLVQELRNVREKLTRALAKTGALEERAEGLEPRVLVARVAETVTLVDPHRPHASSMRVHRAPGDELVIWLDRFTVRIQLDEMGTPSVALEVTE